MNKRLYILSAYFLLTLPLVVHAEANQSIQQQNTQQKMEADLSKVIQQKIEIQDEISATSQKITQLNQQINEYNINIQRKETELNSINKKMDRLNEENQRITLLLQNRKKAFKDRVSSFYRTDGQMSFFNVIFSVNSFGEFIDHFVAYNTIVEKDKKFIETYIADQNKLSDNKEKVRVLQVFTIQAKEQLESIKSSLEGNKKEKEVLSTMLEEKKKQLDKEEQEKKLSLELLQGNEKVILDIINNNQNVSNANLQLIKSIIAPFVTDAQKIQQEKGVPASITIGQIILESSGDFNGLSGLAFESKNLFGVKGIGTAGSVNYVTTEYVNGKKISTTAKFACYKTYYDSMVDHANLLLEPRYQKYLKNVTSIVDYAHGIQDAGYATDPNYADKLLMIIFQYGLWKIDL